MKGVSNRKAGYKPEQGGRGGEDVFANLNDDCTLIVLLTFRLKMLKKQSRSKQDF